MAPKNNPADEADESNSSQSEHERVLVEATERFRTTLGEAYEAALTAHPRKSQVHEATVDFIARMYEAAKVYNNDILAGVGQPPEDKLRKGAVRMYLLVLKMWAQTLEDQLDEGRPDPLQAMINLLTKNNLASDDVLAEIAKMLPKGATVTALRRDL
jgi:hypothetical protein